MNNRDLKCQESIMLALQKGLHKDLGTFHQIPPRECERDFNYVRTRTKAEGLSFLTKTLPQLAKSLDQALLSGTFQCPSNFKTWKGTKLPCYMHWLFKRVFCEDGTVLVDPDVACIKDIRQVGYLFYKYQLPYPDRLVKRTIEEFIEDDSNIKPIRHTLDDAETQSTIYYAQEVINEILKDFHFTAARPKNGPGAVANGLKPWQRYRPSKYWKVLDSTIPYDRIFYNSDRHLFDCWDDWFHLEWSVESQGTARLIAVPKDSRGPRLISCEPSEFMVYQQIMRQEIVPYLETNSLTGGQVNFTDQSINGALALESSKTRKLATLDLSKASDLLSLELVDALYEGTCIHQYLMNTRSSSTMTPLGNQKLRKFAPMGSALCFPIQALSFYAIIVGRMLANNRSLGVAARNVFVYGDDIIVPTYFAHEAMSALESVGLKINHDKSCYTGKFRESCGVDAYNGIDVTPVKIKKLWNTKPDAQTTVSWVAVCNNLFANGYWNCAAKLRHEIDRINRYKFPLCTKDSPIIGYHTWSVVHAKLANNHRLRWNRDLQCAAIRTKVLVTASKPLLKHGWQRLLRFGWERGDSPPPNNIGNFEEPFATDAFTVRHAVQIKHDVVTEASM